MKTKLLVGFTSAALLLASACEDDPVDCCGPPPASPYQSLTTREAVLNNLEVSYNLRHIGECNKLFDANFTMFFSAGDFGSGTTPEQWGRQDEIEANTNLLNRNFVDTDPSDGITPRCLGVSLDVRTEDGMTWEEIDAPGEKWYATTLFYDIQIDIEGDFHLINNSGAKAEFTVRNTGTESEPHWQLVEMRDLGGDVLAHRVSGSTEPSTWGSMKALYH